MTTPAGESRQSELTSQIELYDHEILKIEKHALKPLNDKQGKVLNLEAFRREIIQRFEDIGFIVDVKVWDTTQASTYWFDIDIVDRIERIVFDHDRQVHEVTHDLLDLGEGGVIKSNGIQLP